MKVSSVLENKGNTYMRNSMNLSNEFVKPNLHDQVPYRVVMKNLSDSNEIAERFVNKHRVVKEKTSLGGFRIPAETLKKRVNPSDYLEEINNLNIYDSSNPNPTVNSFSFNPYKGRPMTTKNNAVNLSEPLVDENLNLAYDSNKDLGGNILEIIEKQVEALKRESREQQRMIELSRSSKLRASGNPVDENKVITEYISHNAERVQAIKHVTTNFKPEYMSLEDLQKMKEEHQQKMFHIEKEFYEKKRKEQENIDRLGKIQDEDGKYKQLQDLNMKHMESRKISPEELEDIIKHEEDYFKKRGKEVKNRKPTMNRAKSARGMNRKSRADEEKENEPLDKDEQKFVRKYVNYMLKKQKNEGGKQDLLEDEWNKTRIKSLNANGVANRTDGLPGYIDQDDYSLYYLSIASNTPRSLSIKSASHSKSFSKSRSKSVPRRGKSGHANERVDNKQTTHHTQKTQNKKLRMNRSCDLTNFQPQQTISKNKSSSMGMNSHLAFIKLIYKILDKEKTGHVLKTDILNNMDLEDSILRDLGFTTELDFKEGLSVFPTASADYMTEQELIAFLLSRSDLAEEYLYNLKTNNEENNMQVENDFAFNEKENIDEDYDGHANQQMDFLNYNTTEERLEKLRESFTAKNNNSSLKDHNRSLTSKLKDKIESKSKVNVKYQDYRDFLNKYSMKGELNFTIPKPFEFLKKDYAGKKMKKMEEILMERKRKEDEILGYRFKPNDLKREIFISQFENIIESEKANRRMRTEKLKEKIVQNMRPFSFYEQDERKYKEKLDRRCEAPQFPAFKANAVKWTSQVNLYDDILKKMEVERRARIEQRKMETSKAAKLPPRMEMHEKKKKQEDQEMKLLDKTQTMQRSKSFKANPVKNFAKAHESFMNTLEKKKSMAKPTETKPFNFHEPKKKASLRAYLDKENDPQIQNPQFKNNIVDIIKKIQQKPKIEPASTKSLNLLMATRRKELEEKQRKDEEKVIEDKMRKEKQDRLKERVVNSKALVNNTKALEDKRSKQQEDFKRNLQDKKNAYQQELARRLQRVYNKPLMFEQTSGKVEKFSMNKNMKEKLNDILYNSAGEGDEASEMNMNVIKTEDDDQLYEGKFE